MCPHKTLLSEKNSGQFLQLNVPYQISGLGIYGSYPFTDV
jgi:hypothetical protein